MPLKAKLVLALLFTLLELPGPVARAKQPFSVHNPHLLNHFSVENSMSEANSSVASNDNTTAYLAASELVRYYFCVSGIRTENGKPSCVLLV